MGFWKRIKKKETEQTGSENKGTGASSSEKPLEKSFEDAFMEFQSELISLCIEVLEGKKVDRIFAYCSIEKRSLMFNAFFQNNEGIRAMYMISG